MAKRLILTLGGKGGTGKTLFCRTLYYFLIQAGVNCFGFDADTENPEFHEYHTGSKFPVPPLNFLQVEEAKTLFTQIKDQTPDVVLIDLPGASGKATREQLTTFGVFELAEILGYRLTITSVLNNCYNTINSLIAMMEFCRDQADWVVAKSQVWNQGSLSFTRWDASDGRVQFLNLGGVEIDLPVLELSAFDELHEKNLSFFDMDQLPFGDLILVQSFLTRSQSQLSIAGAYLGLAQGAEAEANKTAKGKSKRGSGKNGNGKEPPVPEAEELIAPSQPEAEAIPVSA